ncbi:hypothetical protein OQA88_1834 [Cercophora sp. LCS_1]
MNAPSLLSRRALSVCHACRRSVGHQRPFSTSPSRSVPAFQSYSLPTQPPAPPRNATAPETSITRPVDNLPRRPPAPPAAPTPTPTQHAQTQPQEKPAAPKPRPSKLRAPRKAAMKLTPAAVEQLRDLLNQPDPKLIKVGVRNRGCSGLAYHLEYVDKAGAFDETVEQDGVKVLIDSKALFSIIGSEMDWVEDKLSQRFVFRNPNIKEECGCGESFMV